MNRRQAALFGLALSVMSISWWIGQRPVESQPPTGVRRPAAAAPSSRPESQGFVLPAGSRISRAQLGSGDTLSAALNRLQVRPERKSEIVAALGRVLDLGRLPSSTGLVTVRRADGTLHSLAVRAEADRFARWTEEGGVEQQSLDVEREVLSGTGEVMHSVRQALDEFPHAEELTVAFADIFQWDIDLLVEPRPGDRVRVVYEIERLGTVPPDLPSLAGAAQHSGETLRLGRVLAATYDGRLAQSTAYWVEQEDGEGGYFDADGAPLRKTFLKSPLNYRRISSRFSRARRNPVTRKVVPHHGVDFAAAPGTPVVAAADGRVTSAGWDGPLGQSIRIKHGSEYTTVYGHLQRFAKGIRAGSQVQQNQVIGFVGSTGRATGPHLHYTLIERGRPIDPLQFRNPPASPLQEKFFPDLQRAMLAWAPLLDDQPTLLAGNESGLLRRGV